jgi:hypothetical protein
MSMPVEVSAPGKARTGRDALYMARTTGIKDQAKQAIISQAISHCQGRLGLAQAMVKPILPKGWVNPWQCDTCSRCHDPAGCDDLDELPMEMNCWRPDGVLFVWDEQPA